MATTKREWYQQNKEKLSEYYKERWPVIRARRYGLKPGEIEKKIQDQDGKCALCNRSTERWQVDHDHQSGEFRAMLCQQCNTALGQFGDSVELLQRAIVYLQKHRKVPLQASQF